MDIEHNFRESTRLKRLFQNRIREKNRERSGDRLNRSIEKKFRTTFIGSLSSFEEAFGHLWGHRMPEEKLTGEQLKLRRLWDQVRTNILNNGNNQLRAAQSEISEYTVEWNRHKTSIPVKGGENAKD